MHMRIIQKRQLNPQNKQKKDYGSRKNKQNRALNPQKNEQKRQSSEHYVNRRICTHSVCDMGTPVHAAEKWGVS